MTMTNNNSEYMSKIHELLIRLNTTAHDLKEIKSQFILQKKGVKALDEIIFINDNYIILLKNYLDNKTDDIVHEKDKAKIQIMHQHYVSAKNIINNFKAI